MWALTCSRYYTIRLTPHLFFPHLHRSHYPLYILDYNVPQRVDGTFLLPRLRKPVFTFGGGWAPPSEVTHTIGPSFSVLRAQWDLCRRVDPCPLQLLVLVSLPLCFILTQLPARQSGETVLGRAPSLQWRAKDFDRPAFTTWRLPPAEMLHWVGASAVAVGLQLWWLPS